MLFISADISVQTMNYIGLFTTDCFIQFAELPKHRNAVSRSLRLCPPQFPPLWSRWRSWFRIIIGHLTNYQNTIRSLQTFLLLFSQVWSEISGYWRARSGGSLERHHTVSLCASEPCGSWSSLLSWDCLHLKRGDFKIWLHSVYVDPKAFGGKIFMGLVS